MNKFGQGAGVLSNAAFLELFSGSDKAHLDLSFAKARSIVAILA